jgi:hypothetical protein
MERLDSIIKKRDLHGFRAEYKAHMGYYALVRVLDWPIGFFWLVYNSEGGVNIEDLRGVMSRAFRIGAHWRVLRFLIQNCGADQIYSVCLYSQAMREANFEKLKLAIKVYPMQDQTRMNNYLNYLMQENFGDLHAVDRLLNYCKRVGWTWNNPNCIWTSDKWHQAQTYKRILLFHPLGESGWGTKKEFIKLLEDYQRVRMDLRHSVLHIQPIWDIIDQFVGVWPII